MMRKGVVEKEMEYADVIWDGCSIEEANLLEAVQYKSARIVTGALWEQIEIVYWKNYVGRI
jgi:hypothetical protein